MRPFRHLVAFVLASTLSTAEPFDHVETIKSLRHGDVKEGRALYKLHCASCHGIDGKLALNPLARKFAEDEMKFGTDPYSLWKTTSYGNGLMFRWDAVLTPKQRYQIVAHIREEIIKPNNPGQYFTPDEAYFEKLPAIAKADAEAQAANTQKVEVAAGMIDGSGGKEMDYGSFVQHGMAFGDIKNKNAEHMENTTEKAMAVALPGGAVLCYDLGRLSVSGVWKGGIANTEKTHHTSYKGGRPLMPGGEVYYKEVDTVGWNVGAAAPPEGIDHFRFKGHYLHGDHVLLDYEVGGRSVQETPGASADGNTVSRSFRVAAGKEVLYCLLGSGESMAKAKLYRSGDVKLIKAKTGTWMVIPPAPKPLSFAVWFSAKGEPEIPAGAALPDFDAMTKGGPRRWAQVAQTALAPGEAVEGYALDELTVPYANPYGAWMRTTALDFFSDGRLAVSTLSGDVWIVSWPKDNPNSLTWSRFASGLYEPLGLKIVDDKIYVRGRDRITRLHDLNKDGEADHYENFFEDRNEIGASYHAFVYDLQTDKAGNFYYSQSGYKSPLEGAVVRVSPDGKSSSFVGTDLRNPNGMGAGGPHDWVTITDNPSGRAVYNGFTLAREGAIYGYEKSRNVPMLVMLPARVDSSSGGQCWSDAKWGPLGGSIIHTSYSRCSAFYCFAQNLEPFPNGFAVQFPFKLNSGAMRPRVSPVDGQVYIAAQKGWDTNASHDGKIYRVRHVGGASHLVSGAEATATGVRLSFACDLDPASVKSANVMLSREGDKKGAAPKGSPPEKVALVDSKTVEITIRGIEDEVLEQRTRKDEKKGTVSVQVNPALVIGVKLRAADGTAIEQTVFATINSLP